MKTRSLIIFTISILMVSCNLKPENEIVTRKIQYDVVINNMRGNYDPWIENIHRENREQFIQDIFEAVYSGTLKAYDYFNKELSLHEVKNIGIDTIYKTLLRTSPPYDEYDTIVIKKISIKDISKIRFLEEWRMNRKTLAFDKKVKAIAPVMDKYDQNGTYLGRQPLFWVYLDKDELK